MSNLTRKERLLNFYRSRPLAVFGVLLLLAAGGAVLGMILLVSIFERKQEARNPFFRVVELTDEIDDPAVWGKNFPQQYDDYRRTVDQQRTRYGGSEAEPRTPTKADPRSVVAQSRIEEDPRLKTMWAGYAFAKDFREERGHAFMLDDQTYTERQQAAKQPGTCLHCHASIKVPYTKAGGGDLMKGFEKFNQMPFAEARKLVTHPVACIDCHDPKTMQLRVTRPGVHRRHARSQSGAGRSELRRQPRRDAAGDARFRLRPMSRRILLQGAGETSRLSLGQRPEGRTTSWPTTTKEQFKDWAHAETGAPVLKAQHPGVRDVEPGHSRALRRRVRRLSHALQTRRRA